MLHRKSKKEKGKNKKSTCSTTDYPTRDTANSYKNPDLGNKSSKKLFGVRNDQKEAMYEME